MSELQSDPIVDVVERWHRFMRGESPGGLDALLHDDVVFFSPIVFTPQRGKHVTTMYLHAAASTLGGDGPSDRDSASSGESGDSTVPAAPGRFRYVKEIAQGHSALLEFETSIDGKYVNGIDLITCDDDGRIVEFKVMIRPLQAVNAVHAQMKAMLESMA